MHYPLEFQLGAARISAHLVFEMLAFTLGYRLYGWLRGRTRDRISDEGRMWVFVGAAAGALVGSHLLGVLEQPAHFARFDLVLWMGNKTIVGGLLGGLIGVEWAKKINGITASSGDLMTYPILLGLAVGRVGCHLAGLTDGTHGLPSSLPWAVDFGDGIPRHPVSLYEIGYLGALAFFISRREKSQPLADGLRFKIFMVGYLFWRFFVEFLKPVPWVAPILGLSVLQLAALAGLLYYRNVWFFQKTKRPPGVSEAA
jgi:phosphatidylglycerol---prolipoprotein diacylglyceryl transferase